MHRYTLANDQTVPGFVVIAVASWAVALAIMTAVGAMVWILYSAADINTLARLPTPVLLLVGIGGAYAGIGSICLWVAMWVYWMAIERSSTVARVGWFLALVFGVHYGALVYAYRVWRGGIRKAEMSPPTLKPTEQ